MSTWKLCINFVYRNCARSMQLMYRKYIQNIYKMYFTLLQPLVYILHTKLKVLCGLNFVYKMYTNACQNLEYILYRNILYRFCIHQLWSTKSVHHTHSIYNLYTTFIQNECTNICRQTGSLIWTYLGPFVVQFPAS